MKRMREVDYEQLGHHVMAETRNESQAKAICVLHVQSLADELQPEIVHIEARRDEKRTRSQALCAALYQRHHPVSDAAMIARSVALWFLLALFVVVLAASFVTHTTTMSLFGMSLPLSIVTGLILTGAATAAGHQAFEHVLRGRVALQGVIATAAFVFVLWGLWQLGAARGLLAGFLATQQQEADSSFVEGADEPIEPEESSPAPKKSLVAMVRDLLGSANVKIMLAADAMVGLLLALIFSIRTDPDFAAWRHLRKLTSELVVLDRARDELVSLIEMAKKQVLAGIMRGRHFEGPNHPPYFLVPALLMMLLANLSPVSAQEKIERHEAVLLDVSGSVGKAGRTSPLFNEYLIATKKLLKTAPPRSRVWVMTISTDSFGGIETLLKGWTPGSKGVFTDDLDRARRQLVGTFESRSSQLAPVAGGTDIFGGIWKVKADLESGGSASSGVKKEIHILSDMMHETRGFQMPALVSNGAERMLAKAKADGLIVPLNGYRVYVRGASTAALTPQIWNTMKEFWTLYFEAAGAELVEYSSETYVER